MPSSSNSKQKRKYKNVKLFCRSCFFQRKKNTKREYRGRCYLPEDNNPEKQKIITCSTLTQHIRGTRECLQYYNKSNCWHYHTSLLEHRHVTKSPRLPTASSMGLTKSKPLNPSNPPTGASLNAGTDVHKVLNDQVLFNWVQPQLERNITNFLRPKDDSPDYNSDLPDNNNFESTFDPCDNIHPDPNHPLINNQQTPNANSSNNLPMPPNHPAVNNLPNPNQNQTSNSSSSSTENLVIPIYPRPRFHFLTPKLISEIELLNILQFHHMPMNMFNHIFNWAERNSNSKKRKHGNERNKLSSPRTREAIIKSICDVIPPVHYSFRTVSIQWEPDDVTRSVYVRDFRQALTSLLTNTTLLKDSNFSFPHKDTPFLKPSFKLKKDCVISELHHGEWWTNTWKSMCQENSNQILVPVIFYMDGISVDSNANLNLTPLNMTLGIFNTATRKLPAAWETLYFHPEKMQSVHKSSGPESASNLHNGLEKALRSFKDLCDNETIVEWAELPYNGSKWKVQMKFAIAYVIGDTQLHDQLCCRYASYNVNQVCRHCRVETDDLCNPKDDSYKTSLWVPHDFVVDVVNETDDKDRFRDMCHYRISNVFHTLNFGSNVNNIHLATPGECLHMHQLGVAKRTIESIAKLVSGEKAERLFCNMALKYGGLISRQSDRCFPRTRFTPNTNILNTSMKEGKDLAGMLLCILVTILSDDGRELLPIETKALKDQISFIELVLQMEEFLKRGEIRRSELPLLEAMMTHFVDTIRRCCNRNTGMNNKLIKNHLFLHVPQYIRLWGPPTGWDSAPSESHHKTEIKGPSKNTQRSAATLVQQTFQRKKEKHILSRVTQLYSDIYQDHDISPPTKPNDDNGNNYFGGAEFYIKLQNDKPCMEWERLYNQTKTKLPDLVLEFCCKQVLPVTGKNTIRGYTVHHREDGDGNKYIFRAHPSFRHTSGQTCNVWYDWALFVADDQLIPCQIMCFVHIDTLADIPERLVSGYPVNHTGQYAIVRRFSSAPTPHRWSKFVSTGNLLEDLFLFHCDMIEKEVAVVKNFSQTAEDSFFVIRNRNEWLTPFFEKMKSFGTN